MNKIEKAIQKFDKQRGLWKDMANDKVQTKHIRFMASCYCTALCGAIIELEKLNKEG